VADLNTRISKYDLEREFDRYGRVLDLILIRRCPTVCFIVYKYGKDARYAAKKLHNMSIWNTRLRAELAKPSGKNPRITFLRITISDKSAISSKFDFYD